MSVLAAATILLLVPAIDWPQWRGPSGQNYAAADADPPVEWSANRNVAWKAAVPGEGHASPTVVGGRVVLALADRAGRSVGVVAYDADSGELLWSRTSASRVTFPRMHPKNSHASPTVASDGSRLFASFLYDDAIHVFGYDLDGTELWKATAGPFRPQRFQFGYGASPTVYRDTVIVANESDGPAGAGLIAFDAATGAVRWKRERRGTITFGSPILGTPGGTPQLLIAGGGNIAGFDPTTGKPLWSAGGFATAACGTPVWEGSTVFASGGYPEQITMAVDSGTGRVVWSNSVKCYEQSMLIYEGVLYGVDESGVLNAWDAASGERLFRERLGGDQSASLLLATGGTAGPRIYHTNEVGETFVFRAGRTYEPLAKNELGDVTFATPSPVGSALFTRVGIREGGEVQHYLFRLEE